MKIWLQILKQLDLNINLQPKPHCQNFDHKPSQIQHNEFSKVNIGHAEITTITKIFFQRFVDNIIWMPEFNYVTKFARNVYPQKLANGRTTAQQKQLQPVAAINNFLLSTLINGNFTASMNPQSASLVKSYAYLLESIMIRSGLK
jgi:hypothetical protein